MGWVKIFPISKVCSAIQKTIRQANFYILICFTWHPCQRKYTRKVCLQFCRHQIQSTVRNRLLALFALWLILFFFLLVIISIRKICKTSRAYYFNLKLYAVVLKKSFSFNITSKNPVQVTITFILRRLRNI